MFYCALIKAAQRDVQVRSQTETAADEFHVLGSDDVVWAERGTDQFGEVLWM